MTSVFNQALNTKNFYSAIHFLQAAIEIAPKEQSFDVNQVLHTFDEPQVNVTELKEQYEKTITYHDEHLVRTPTSLASRVASTTFTLF